MSDAQPAPERARVTVSLDVKIAMDVSDDGYLGTGATVEEHIKKARDDASRWTFLVRQGSLDPKPVRAKVDILAVSIVPKGD